MIAQSALDWSSRETQRVASLPAVSVATDSTWPPMEYFNRDGHLVGFDIDLLREVGRRAGFRPVFETVPWDGIFIGLAARRYDMIASSVTVLEERERMMLFSDPYLNAAQYLVVPRNRTDVTGIADLAGEDLGAQIGTTGARIANQAGARVRTYDDLGLAVEDLAQGRLSGIVADVAIVEYYIFGVSQYGDRFTVLDQPYAIEEYAFAIRRDQPQLRDAINAALREIRRDGVLSELKQFWFRNIDLSNQ